jgi:hypothetical protein
MQTARLLENENFFIARRAYWFLDGRPVNELTAGRIHSFREKSKNEGRVISSQ